MSEENSSTNRSSALSKQKKRFPWGRIAKFVLRLAFWAYRLYKWYSSLTEAPLD